MTIVTSQKERTILLAIEGQGDDWRHSLDELARLAETAGGEVVGEVTQRRDRPDPVYYVGKGKAHEMNGLVSELKADLVLVDGEITPSQEHNLEDATGAGVLGRSAIILDIFAMRARSAEGKLQVELAQLNYLLPRLTGKGTALSRLGGGIGTRGPGETKLSVDRRHIRKRLSMLKSAVQRLETRRAAERRHRQEAGIAVAALVGYTNAGKSTLLNTLSGSEVFVEDRLFATLDPTVRRVALPGGRDVLVADTVGFIRNLPHQLIAAFRATLEEMIEADVLVHVVDASHPQMHDQIDAAQRVLAELKAATKPQVMAFNKIDQVSDRARLDERIERDQYAVAVSALTGEGIEGLLRTVGERLEHMLVPVDVQVPFSAQDLLAEAHARGRVISQEFGPEAIALSARVPADLAQRLRNAAGIAEEVPAEP